MTTLTMLNEMAGNDFSAALQTHREWGLRTLDLKGSIFGKSLLDLTDEQAIEAARLISLQGMDVYCFSTTLFHPEVELGEEQFRRAQLAGVTRAIELASIMHPRVIRLLGAQTRLRAEEVDSIAYLRREQPWVIPLYQEAVAMIAGAGYHATIENEVGACIFSVPDEVLDFFHELSCPDTAHFTWDVQNFWQCGTFPTLSVYQQLKPLIGYYHVKGGQVGDDGNALRWNSSLEDASWPVVEITRQVVLDNVSPVICLNPSHGECKPGYDYSDRFRRDVEFLRRAIPEIS